MRTFTFIVAVLLIGGCLYAVAHDAAYAAGALLGLLIATPFAIRRWNADTDEWRRAAQNVADRDETR